MLVLGATSAIALAYCRRLQHRRPFVLVGRHDDRLDHLNRPQSAWRASGNTCGLRSRRHDSCERRFLDFCARIGMPDQVLIGLWHCLAIRSRPSRSGCDTAIIDVNFMSAALWMQMAAKHLPRDGRVRLLSSPRWPAIADAARTTSMARPKLGSQCSPRV